MGHSSEPIGAYNFLLEVSGVTAAFARQVLGLEAIAPGAGVGAKPPASVAGVGGRFGGSYYVPGATHGLGGSQWASPGARLTSSQARVILLGLVPADQRGADQLLRWWQQRDSAAQGRRVVAVSRRDASGRELRRHTMEGWVVEWQGPPPVPGRPDPPPETARVEIAVAGLRAGR